MKNALFPIDVTDEGTDTLVSEEHSLNKFAGIVFMSPRMTSETIPLKMFSPKDVTEEGIVISASDLQLTKLLSPIDVTDEGIVTFANE